MNALRRQLLGGREVTWMSRIIPLRCNLKYRTHCLWFAATCIFKLLESSLQLPPARCRKPTAPLVNNSPGRDCQPFPLATDFPLVDRKHFPLQTGTYTPIVESHTHSLLFLIQNNVSQSHHR